MNHTRAHLEDRQRAAILGYPPSICFGDVLHSRRGHGFNFKPAGVGLFQVLNYLHPTDAGFAQVSEEVP
jgi:hypothetical protein